MRILLLLLLDDVVTLRSARVGGGGEVSAQLGHVADFGTLASDDISNVSFVGNSTKPGGGALSALELQASRLNNRRTHSSQTSRRILPPLGFFRAQAFPLLGYIWAFVSYNAANLISGTWTTADLMYNFGKVMGVADLAASAVGGAVSVLANVADGACKSSDILQTEYMQVQKLRERLRQLSTTCQKQEGLLPFLLPGLVPEAAHSEVITRHVAALDGALGAVLEDVFCPGFQHALQGTLQQLIDVAGAWEQRRGQLWWPKRVVSHTVFYGLGNDPKKIQELADRFGLTVGEVRRQVNKAMRWGGGPPGQSLHFNDFTVYPDTLLDDDTEPEENKRSFRGLLNGTRVLFGEMATLSDVCRQRAKDVKAENKFCKICTWCCKLPPKWPALLQWFEKKYKEVNDGNPWVGAWVATASDLYSIISAATRGPWYVFYLAAKVVGAGFGGQRRKACARVAQVLKNSSRADGGDKPEDDDSSGEAASEEVGEETANKDIEVWMKASVHRFQEMRKEKVQANLPEPGDSDFHS